MRCKACKGTHSWHDWEHKPFCSPFCRGDFGTILLPKRKSGNKYGYGNVTEETLQPLKADGTVSGDFVKVYGTEQIEKTYKLSKQEIHHNIELYD